MFINKIPPRCVGILFPADIQVQHRIQSSELSFLGIGRVFKPADESDNTLNIVPSRKWDAKGLHAGSIVAVNDIQRWISRRKSISLVLPP